MFEISDDDDSLRKICSLRMDCIVISCNQEKNMTTNVKEQRIEYGPRSLTDWERQWKNLAIG